MRYNRNRIPDHFLSISFIQISVNSIMDQINKTHKIEHHTVIIVGGGPAGLPIAAVLGGWHPYYRESAIFSHR